MPYDYKQRKTETYKILYSTTEVSTKNAISEIESETGGSLTFSNGIRSWIVSIFIDIRNSTKLFKEEKDITIAKIIRVFTSEVIQILNDTKLYKRIGIRGDCVFAVFDASNTYNVVEVYYMAIYINTLKGMINSILKERNMPTINYGIGLGLSQDLVIKAGKSKVVNDLVFVGGVVVNASNLSGLASKGNIEGIAMDECTYNNIREIEK